MEKELLLFNSYQSEYEKQMRVKRLEKIKVQKVREYKIMWGAKNFFYKLIHRNLSPANNDLRKMVVEDIDGLINKLTMVKKIIII